MQHLMMDLYHVESARLANRALLLKVLSDYPGEIDMEAAGPPVLRAIKTSHLLDDVEIHLVERATRSPRLMLLRGVRQRPLSLL